MTSRQKIQAEEVVADIREGMNDSQLMEKYRVSPTALRDLFDKLLSAEMMDLSALRGREVDRSKEGDPSARRELPRSYVLLPVPITDTNSPDAPGRVYDISEKGLQVVGISARVGDVTQLVIPGDGFADISSISFEAKCRWGSPELVEGQYTTGWEVTDISSEKLGELRKLIRFMSLDGE
jgi:PilZ domain